MIFCLFYQFSSNAPIQRIVSNKKRVFYHKFINKCAVIDGVVLIGNNLLIVIVAFIRETLPLTFRLEFRCWKVSSSNKDLNELMADMNKISWWEKSNSERCILPLTSSACFMIFLTFAVPNW
jgi:hypothetical protein